MSSEDSDLAFLQGVLLTMLEASDEGLIVLDATGRCRMLGRRAADMFGIDATASVGKPGVEVLEAFAKACEDPDSFWRAAAAPLGSPGTEAEVEVRRPVARTVLCRAIALGRELSAREAKWGGRVIFVRDVTLERAAESSTRQLRARLRALMPFDALTGLLNQRRLYEELGREHSRSTRAWDSYALLRADVDAMARLNTEFGSPAGDQLLEQIARRLETCVREYDVLARLEGDEFGVLLPGADGLAARAVAGRMSRAVAETEFVLHAPAPAAQLVSERRGSVPLHEPLLPIERTVSLSIGVALWLPPSRDSAEGIFRRAGEALRQARSGGGGGMHVFGSGQGE
jgi:diguanylate cyclase (GGDEF)-like protein